MCNACKIKGMAKKKKAHVSGMGGDILEEVLISLTPGAGMILAYEAKDSLLPMLTKDGATADEQKMTSRIVNGVVIGAGLLGVYLTPPEAKKYVIPGVGGIIGECMFSMWLTEVKKTAPVIRGFDNRAYSLAAEQKRILEERSKMKGLDNTAPSLMGLTRIDEIGAPLPGPYTKASVGL